MILTTMVHIRAHTHRASLNQHMNKGIQDNELILVMQGSLPDQLQP